MYHSPGPVIIGGGGIVGGGLAVTGIDTLFWAAVAALLIIAGLVFIRLSSVARANRH